MKRSGFAVWGGIVICLSVIPGLVFAGPPDNYTAALVMEGMSMSIAKMGGKTRSESPMLQGMVNLHLLDAQKMIMMSPANKTCKDLEGLIIRNETTLPPGKMGGVERKVVTELKDVKIGAAQASMFEVPKDYRKVENRMEMMGGMDKMKEMFKQQMKPK